ncbi:hypothetical protein [Streptomyces boninensis]|uniref:hypothetical protein n=1 Tax=Streptomyces boninensis TaxID=2039455 RepID=UPI003B22624D
MLDVSDDVRAEIGDEEADRLLAGDNAPGQYDCTSCRTPGDSERERTSTVLFVGDETAVLAFAHATCVPSQVVPVSEDQLQGAVRAITSQEDGAPAPAPAPAAVGAGAGAGGDGPPPVIPQPAALQPAAPAPAPSPEPAATDAPQQAVLGVTCGLVLCGEELRPALVVEPTGPIARPGSTGPGDDFLPLLIEQGFLPVMDVDKPPSGVDGWSVLLVEGMLHAVMQPSPGGEPPTAWWQAHQPLQVTEGWRTIAAKSHEVLVYAAPAGAIGRQPREDLLREALERAASRGTLVGSAMRLTGA